jgi:hypothetical protein
LRRFGRARAVVTIKEEVAVSQRPTVVGLPVCEQVVVEEGTKNVTLVNCFTALKVSKFPSEPRRFVVFAVLTDGAGDVNLEVVITRLEDNEEIYRQSARVRFADRLREVRFIFRVGNCTFPTAGE